MGIIERKQRQREALRKDILQIARELAGREGWGSVSIRKIADLIEYSPPVIYEHFENKEAILMALKMEGFQTLLADSRQAASLYTQPADRLLAQARAYWHFALAHTDLYQVMFSIGGVACGLQHMPKEAQAHVDHSGHSIRETLAELVAAGRYPDADVSFKFEAFWALLHGLVSLALVNKIGCHQRVEKILDDAVQGFIRSL